ncbi:YesK family protein [Scopulibacillus darangshiensis]
MICAIFVVSLFHHIQKKRTNRKNLSYVIFIPMLIFSLVLFPISFILVGGWHGLFLAAIGVYLFFTSVSALIFATILKIFSNRKRKL